MVQINATFESGDKREFDSEVNAANLVVNTGAALVGSYGLQVDTAAGTESYGQVDFTQFSASGYSLGVRLDPNADGATDPLVMATADAFDVSMLLGGTIQLIRLRMRYDGVSHEIRLYVRQDSGWAYTNRYDISDASHWIEGNVTRGTGGTAQGVLRIDGVTQETLTGLTIDTLSQPDNFQVGAVQTVDVGTDGLFLLDHVAATDNNQEIGAPPDLPAVPLVGPVVDAEDMARVGDFTPTFDWNDPGGGADRVQIQVDMNSDFSSPEIDQTVLIATATEYTPPSDMAQGLHYVRLRSSDGTNYGSWAIIYEVGVYPPAFPGAEGPGAFTPGGRGGTVIEVTNTNNGGTGSFRSAVEASGARIVIFRTGGTVTLTSEVNIRDPYLTIAGHTAPGGGFCVGGEPVRLESHDVIIRCLRFRLGDGGSYTGNNDSLSLQMDVAAVSSVDRRVHDVIIDHCSTSWGEDETVSFWNDEATLVLRRITFQWSIISEALGDGVGGASRGLITGYDCDQMAVHHCLLVHNRDRNIRIRGGRVEYLNNVLYNTLHKTRVYIYDSGIEVNFVKNYHRTGGGDDGNNNFIIIREDSGSEVPLFYVLGNIGQYRTQQTDPEWDITSSAWNSGVPASTNYQSLQRFSMRGQPISEKDYLNAYQDILALVGASYPQRDSADNRIISDTKNLTGSRIDSQTEVGGWPTLAAGTAPTDTDGDGMSDEFESSFGVSAANNYDLHPRYTNLEIEVFRIGLNQKRIKAGAGQLRGGLR